MTISSNITNLYEGESLTITVAITDSAGNPVSNPGDFTVELLIAESPYDSAILTFNSAPYVTLLDAVNAKWLIKIPSAQFSSLVLSKKYYYNIWSTEDGEDPVLQVKGQLTINDAIN